MKKQHGFSVIEVVIVLAVVAVIGLVIYNVATRTQDANQNTQDTVSTAEPAALPAAPEVNSTSDLDAASETLDKIDPDQNDAGVSDVDSELSNF